MCPTLILLRLGIAVGMAGTILGLLALAGQHPNILDASVFGALSYIGARVLTS